MQNREAIARRHATGLWCKPSANGVFASAKPEKKKRGPKKRHLHGRPNLDHLPRVPELHAVGREQRVCPKCGVEAATLRFTATLSPRGAREDPPGEKKLAALLPENYVPGVDVAAPSAAA